MSKTSPCINDVLPTEILQKVFLLSAESMHDALRISLTCRLWRELIYNPVLISHYWIFDEQRRRKGLVNWWNFDGTANNHNNPFASCHVENCFLGQSVSFAPTHDESGETAVDTRQNTIDRGSDYTSACWFRCPETGRAPRCLFMISDDDWDYARSAGVAVDQDNFFSIVFTSSISERIVKSDVPMEPNQWFHIALVQKQEEEEESLQQDLWINGRRALTTEVPIAAFSSNATVAFSLGEEWAHSLADVSIWSRRLSPLEIRAINAQKTSIDKVDVPLYIFTHKNT